ncbi:PREDICTED: uncharacterized protein LOC108366188 isoform X1 [Rhagoletis zephyria]|uniref:uncharacterized protein LOC108366188 isoform X1 n=1 Tax=Rhagoletis zephyria TaxID=28612 RepID=UPI00081137BD|nr:PREDICTED: uncharacterized protein LOC108366188 isoform X1 [Rhagoletis zephyria]
MSYFDVLELREYCRAAMMMSSVLCVKNFTVAEASNSQNYFVKDKMAYTEDNVLIYNIFVYSIPKKFNEDDVRCYFSKFGKVSNVRLVPDRKRSRRAAPKVGFVNFAEPAGAFSALRKGNHRLQGSRIGVKAGDSWNQPDAEKACSQKPNETDAASTSAESKQKNKSEEVKPAATPTYHAASVEGLNVLALNDDCLEMICRLLELRDQVRFARVCQRFQDVFKMFSKHEFKNFDLYKMSGMTLWEIRDFFRFAGENIEHVAGNIPFKNRERIIEFIRIFCSNLKRISLDDSKMRPECLKKLLRNFPLLKDLNLHDCSLNDSSVQTLHHLDKLESLALSENYELTGKFISGLVQLKALNLYGCSNIQTTNLIEICKAMQNLKTLDIRRCERLSIAFFDAMPEHCQQLEVLKMSCPDFSYEKVASLPRLKQLELLRHSSGFISNTRLFVELVAQKADQLETLKIVAKNSLTAEHVNLISDLKKLKTLFCANNQAVDDDALRKFCKLDQLEELTIKSCGDITNEGLLRLLRCCRHLRHINIQFCKKITLEFISKAITILKDRTDRPKAPLIILVYGTSIDNYGLSACQEYKAAEKESLMKVVFHALNIDLGLDDGVDIYDIWDGDGWLDDDDDDDDDYDPTDEDDDFYFPDSDMDDDDINFAYNMFGQIYPHGFDIDDVIW